MPEVRVAVVGDLDPESPTHAATIDAIDHGSAARDVACEWVATTDVFNKEIDASTESGSLRGVPTRAWMAP